ncbi:MAG: choice-of-anchor J domain-containing protein [Bacteroidaceae bacterium]|nr:choice-of-anchor J domain-containing protein [Bacteroidaceae bacterium]
MKKTLLMAMAAAMLSLHISAQKAPARHSAIQKKGAGLQMLSAKGALDLDAVARGRKAPQKAAGNVIYSQDFNNELEGINNMTVIDTNGDEHTWEWYGNRARCSYDRVNKADDWLISEAIHLEANKLYTFSIKGQAYSDRYAERYEVKLGTAATAEAMTMQIIEPQVVKSEVKVECTNDHITVPVTGDYYIGVHGISDPDCMYLYVDDIVLAEGAEISNPGKVTDLTITPDAAGALAATISFKAPTTQINGTALTAAMNIEVSRDGNVIKTFESVQPGEACSFVDEAVPYAGAHEYSIKAKVGDGDGDTYVMKVYVGIDEPSALQGVRVVDRNNTVDFCFDPISKTGLHGGVVIPEETTVDLWSVYFNDLSGGVSLQELVESGNTSPITTTYKTNVGEQAVEYWAMIPWNEAGNGPTEWVPMFVGAPTPIPYFETFKGHKFNNFWTYDISSASVVLNYGYSSSDDDGSSIVFASVSDDEYGFIESGKIDIKGAAEATISLDVKGEPGNTVTVQAIGTDGRYITIATLPLTDEYVTHAISLKNFNKGNFVRVRVQANFAKAGSVFIDNICVLNQLDKNLAVTEIAIEDKPKIGSESEVLVTVTNYGKQTIEDYTINLYANGEKVAEQKGSMELEPMKNVTEIISFVPSIFCTGTLELKGEVIFAEDMDANDNSKAMTVEISQSAEDTPEGFAVKFEDGKALLSWDKATDTPKVVTEDFESYTPWIVEPNEPYSTTTLGPWTLVNNDLSYAGYLWNDYELPCEFQTFAYVVTNMDDVFGEEGNIYPGHSGKQYLSTFYGYDIESLDIETMDMDFAEQDDWIISPELSGREQEISFWYQAPSPEMMLSEYFYIQTSTTDNKLESFTPLTDDLFEVKTSAEYDDWKEFKITLPAGTKYFAIDRNDGADDGMWFMLDDITYEKVKKLPVSYNIYLDHQLVATIPGDAENYTLECDINKLHEYSITAVYSNGVESEPASIIDDVTAINGVRADGEKNTILFNIAGQRVNNNANGFIIKKGKKFIRK